MPHFNGGQDSMRRAYLVYQRDPWRCRGNCEDGSAPWMHVAIAVLDSQEQSYSAMGSRATIRHHYDAVTSMKGQNAQLPTKLVWDDEIWLAAEISNIRAEESFREIVDRVVSAHSPLLWTRQRDLT